MTNEEIIRQIVKMFGKCTVNDIAVVAHARGVGNSLQSANTIVRRILKTMEFNKEVKQEKIEGRSVYMLHHLTGYRDHDALITEALVMLAVRWEIKVIREKIIEDVALIPDLIVFIRNGNRSACLIVEAINNESANFFRQKSATWKSWTRSNEYLSTVTGYVVPHFHLVTHGKKIDESTMSLENAIKLMEEQNE